MAINTYILLTPITPTMLGYRHNHWDSMLKGLRNKGIDVEVSNNNGKELVFAVAPAKDHLDDLCTACNIGGIVLNFGAVYDQIVEADEVQPEAKPEAEPEAEAPASDKPSDVPDELRAVEVAESL